MQSKTTSFSLIALCAVLSVLLWWRVSAANAEKEQLNARLSALTQQLAAAAKQPTPTPIPASTPPESAAKRPVIVQAATPLNPKLADDLAAARSRISELESKVLSLDADRATLAQQRQQELAAAEENSRTKIAETERALQSAQADLKAAQQRASLFESENDNLRKAQTPKTVAHAASPATPSSELDELSHRREAYLKNLIRRYRELDNEYRTLIRDAQTTHAADPALLRIQSVLSQAEEDLRQIDSLDAKTLLVEKRRTAQREP